MRASQNRQRGSRPGADPGPSLSNGGHIVKTPDLSRYDYDSLERMLYSYRSLARTHLESGHWALAKWATRMVTLVVIEMAARDRRTAELEDAQLTID
jgi:hypothetical protein